MRTAVWFLAATVLTAVLAACGDSEVGLSCSEPAPLVGTFSGASPRYFVKVIDGADVWAETQRMEGTLGLTAFGVYDFVQVFAADLAPSQLLAVRCDGAVAAVYSNGSESGLSCDDPAPLGGDPRSTTICYVDVIDGADLVAETHRMETTYGFTADPIPIYEWSQGFYASLTSSQLSLVLCDDAVEFAYYPQPLYPWE